MPDADGMCRCMDCYHSKSVMRTVRFGDSAREVNTKICAVDELRPALVQHKWRRCEKHRPRR